MTASLGFGTGNEPGLPPVSLPATGNPPPEAAPAPQEPLKLTIAPQGATPPADGSVKSDFMAARSIAARGNVSLESLASLAPGKEPAGGLQPVKPPPISDPSLPFGTRLLDTVFKINKGMGSMVQAAGEPLLDMASRTTADIGKGVIDAPRQMIGGALDAVNNISRFADDAVKSAEKAGLPNIYVQFTGADGKFSPSIISTDQFRKMQAEGKTDILQVPTTGQPDTVTGNIVRAGTSFMLGRGNMASEGGLAANLGADFVSGTTAMNPNQPRISNIIDQVAPNFVTDFLKAKPEDEGTLLGHLKNGMEMAGLGAAFAGVKKAVVNLKSSAPDNFTSALDNPKPAPAAPAEGANPFLPLGDESQSAISIKGISESPEEAAARIAAADSGAPMPYKPTVTPELQQKAADYLSGKTGENPVHINLAHIGSADDIKKTIEQVATYIPQNAVQSNEATAILADSLGMQPQDFLNGFKGGNLNAQQSLAARMMLDSSAEQLNKFAKLATDPTTATPEAQATFARAWTTHLALQSYVKNAATEAGRTLQSWNIMAKGTTNYTKAIKGLIEDMGGADSITDIAQKVAQMDSPLQIGKLVAADGQASGRDMFMNMYYNVLLSNPKTVIKKLASDSTLNMWNLATHYVAENYGESGDIPAGETAQRAYGYVSAFKDGLRLAGKALMTGESQMGDTPLDAMKAMRLHALADGAPESLAMDAPTSAAASFLNAALPKNWIVAANDFQEYLNFASSIRGQLFREGRGLGFTGQDLADYMTDGMNDVPFHVSEQAFADARYNAFMEPLTGWQKTGQRMLNQMNIPIAGTQFELPVGRILMPFYQIPANIAKWGYRNSALGAAFPSDIIKAQLAAGGATRDLAIARMGLGSMLALSFADLAMNNAITGKGPSTPEMHSAWQQAGNQPYSIRIGDKWYGYNNLEPVGMVLGTMGDTFDAMRFATEKDQQNLAASLIFGMGNSMMSKTYMQGLSNFFEALQNPDTDGNRWAQNVLTGMLVPSGIKGIDDGTDRWYRAHYDLKQSIESKVPFASGQLPELLSLWGDPIPKKDGFMPLMTGTGIARMLSPVPVGPAGGEPIDKWIWDNHTQFANSPDGKLGLSKPGKIQNFSAGKAVSTQVELSPLQLYRLQKLVGNELKDGNGLGAKDHLNALVTGSSLDAGEQRMWDSSSPAVKAVMVQAIFTKYKTAAKQQLMQEDPQLKSIVESGWQGRANQLTAQ